MVPVELGGCPDGFLGSPVAERNPDELGLIVGMRHPRTISFRPYGGSDSLFLLKPVEGQQVMGPTYRTPLDLIGDWFPYDSAGSHPLEHSTMDVSLTDDFLTLAIHIFGPGYGPSTPLKPTDVCDILALFETAKAPQRARMEVFAGCTVTGVLGDAVVVVVVRRS